MEASERLRLDLEVKRDFDKLSARLKPFEDSLARLDDSKRIEIHDRLVLVEREIGYAPLESFSLIESKRESIQARDRLRKEYAAECSRLLRVWEEISRAREAMCKDDDLKKICSKEGSIRKFLANLGNSPGELCLPSSSPWSSFEDRTTELNGVLDKLVRGFQDCQGEHDALSRVMIAMEALNKCPRRPGSIRGNGERYRAWLADGNLQCMDNGKGQG